MAVRAKPGIITPSHRRGNHVVHRTHTSLGCVQRRHGTAGPPEDPANTPPTPVVALVRRQLPSQGQSLRVGAGEDGGLVELTWLPRPRVDPSLWLLSERGLIWGLGAEMDTCRICCRSSDVFLSRYFNARVLAGPKTQHQRQRHSYLVDTAP